MQIWVAISCVFAVTVSSIPISLGGGVPSGTGPAITALFDRSVSPLSLTYAGECYVEAAKRILSIKRELEHQIDDIQDCQKGRLSIGCGRQLSPILLPIIIPVFMSKYPGFIVKLCEEKMSVWENMLCSGDLDIAFSYAKIDNNMLRCTPFFDEEIVLLTPTSFTPPAGIKKNEHTFPIFDFSNIEEHPFVLFKTGHYLRGFTDMIFTDFGIHPNVVLETDNWRTCLSMVENGIAFTLLPYSPIAKKDLTDNLSCYSIDGNYYRHLFIYYRKNTYHQKIIEKFISLAQTTINEMANEKHTTNLSP